jgi:tetratricopeptide (TPR) repeat protein
VDWFWAYPADAQATFVGRDSCASCHVDQIHTWTGSNHDRAMETATEASVLGDFNDATFTRHGVTTRFFRRDGKFLVNTEGPDGDLHDYEIKYTFGINPLQQYMVEFPGGRLQVLTVSWDVRKKEWFMVTPPDVPDERILPGDPLHWTGLAQNWNTMCAECHSTNVQKNFDLASNSYHTTYSEMDVSCETCHGPSSLHVAIAESKSLFWDRRHGYGLPDLKGQTNQQQLETCAPCHSRRSQLHPDTHRGEGFLNFYHPSLLDAGLYFPDGQIEDEVYGYASFLQSKMFDRGIRCTDCHNAHSLQLKYEGNRMCCHCHQPGKYDGPNHHHHQEEGPQTLCVTCHMPTRYYMVVDDRHDHSLRIPRPDLGDALGSPNACTQCHTQPEETNAWAAEAIRKWYGDKRPDDPHYGPTILAGRLGKPEGLDMIRRLLKKQYQVDIVRATAVSLLGQYRNRESDALCRDMLDDTNPLVRAAAIESLSENALPQFVLEVAARLDDPVRLVRSVAARRLVAAAAEIANLRYQDALDRAIAEFKVGLEEVLDRAASHLNLAMLYHSLGKNKLAKQELETAIRLEPYLTGPRDQLAQLVEMMGGDPAEIRRLREEEVRNLERDAALLPTNADVRYRLGMLQYLLGRIDLARQALEDACKLAEGSYDNWLALALLCEQQRDWKRAYEALGSMYQIRPKDPAIRDLFRRIQETRAALGEDLKEVPEETEEDDAGQ